MTSPIHEIHKSLGACFCEIKGWEMPGHYSNPIEEHLNVRRCAGISDLSHRSKVILSGKDRTPFLQKILSQDINSLTPSSGAYSTLLDVKGRMLAYMKIYCDEDSFFIDLEPGLSEIFVQALKHYQFREDVVMEDVTERYGLITVQGPQSRQLLSSVANMDIKDMPECSHINLPINNINTKAVRTSYTGEEGYDIYALRDEIHTVWDALIRGTSRISPGNTGSAPLFGPIFGIEALETLRIEAGTPVYFSDMDEHTIPVESNLDKAISYTKGCYIGQETISRIKFRGHVNRTLTGFYIDGDIVPVKGDKIIKIIHDIEQNVGVITSACHSPTLNKIIAMGYIRIECNEPGETIYIERDPQRFTAVVTKLPFYTRD